MLHNDSTPQVSGFARQAVKAATLGSRSDSSGVKVMSAAAVTSCLQAVRQLLSSELATTTDIALPRHLDAKTLDFSLDSLHEIDCYLNLLHDNEEQIVGQPLLSTIWTIATYLGEVIRRAAPEKKYEWVTIGEESVPAGDSTKHAGIGAVRALRSVGGDMSMPSRAVLQIILRGSKARSALSYARGAIGLLA